MPNIQLYIEAENHAQLLEELRGLVEAYGVNTHKWTVEVDAPRWDPPDSEDAPQGDGVEAPPAPTPPSADVHRGSGRPNPTKATVKLAEEMGIKIENINGSGKDGRVTQADVKAAAKEANENHINSGGGDPDKERLETSEGPSTEPEPPEQEAEVPATDPFSEENTAPEPAASDATIEPTKDNAVAALRVVNDVHDMDACMDVLSRFDAKRIGDVPADKYGDFIGACATRCGLEAPDLKGRMDAFAS